MHHSDQNDYYRLPASEKQITYARSLSGRSGIALPKGVERDRRALSDWIDKAKSAPPKNKFSNYPSSKQVAFAERIARMKRRTVPQECFKDRTMMSHWIDSNL